MTDFIFREMLIEDYLKAFELWQRTEGMALSLADSRENINRFLERNERLSFVCINDGNLIGTVLAGHDGRRGYIYHLAVDKEFRKKAIARELIKKSIEGLRNYGIEKCHLFVLNTNVSGEDFWAHEGWAKRDDIIVFSSDI
ncbi:MAG TPA: GNAT family N-acetyltransferase [Lentisphaeria bacterium]|nr:MAG: GNAT family N-acetyltransferase [Lentisphaerae bacterium GWF2_38_69]HBM16760.1 GNAT family N-acetyltransferase [Lentisphaeria bacterium]